MTHACSDGENLYSILGVSRNADQEELKHAYRREALKWHPDKHCGAADAGERFKKISVAYRVLANPENRLAYDNGTLTESGPSRKIIVKTYGWKYLNISFYQVEESPPGEQSSPKSDMQDVDKQTSSPFDFFNEKIRTGDAFGAWPIYNSLIRNFSRDQSDLEQNNNTATSNPVNQRNNCNEREKKIQYLWDELQAGDLSEEEYTHLMQEQQRAHVWEAYQSGVYTKKEYEELVKVM